ncbi:MAG: hypothetical protein WC823_00080 [Parcubacteria group bacterium]|jgi:hypothetical protein
MRKKIKDLAKRVWQAAIIKSWKWFRKWLNRSRFVLFLVGLVIGGTFTYCYILLDTTYTVVIYNNSPIEAARAETLETATVEEKEEKTSYAIEIVKKIAKEEGIDWKLVYAVCLKESGCKIPNCSKARGNCDGLQSMGPYQIHKPSHPDITEAQANDLAWSTRWTIRHGIRYQDNPALFFKNHNGIGKTTNQWYVDGAMEIYKNI